MKKLILSLAIPLLFSSFVFSQVKKIGYINSSELLLLMPERKEAETKLQADAKVLEAQLKTMSSEYQTKVDEYNAQQSTMSELLKQTKAKEITDLEERIKSFQASAQDELQSTEQKLLEPILAKARQAVKDVAAANGYSHVFDSSSGILIHAPESDDIILLVKKHLNLQ